MLSIPQVKLSSPKGQLGILQAKINPLFWAKPGHCSCSFGLPRIATQVNSLCNYEEAVGDSRGYDGDFPGYIGDSPDSIGESLGYTANHNDLFQYHVAIMIAIISCSSRRLLMRTRNCLLISSYITITLCAVPISFLSFFASTLSSEHLDVIV
ncbi:hypothetical protein EDC04DRAFT_1139653 [Pisolithus marmoratus]|nr:hypothetical protein EDC04DRAFT_1139653 [Pisolithus marmoratus]